MKLLMEAPFFGLLLLRLELVASDAEREIDLMATDGSCLFYNPKEVVALSEDELKSVLAHEVLHCALEHLTRRRGHHWLLWNIAADYVVNALLLRQGFRLPLGTLSGGGFAKLSVEEAYDKLASLPEIQKAIQADTLLISLISLSNGRFFPPGRDILLPQGYDALLWREAVRRAWRFSTQYGNHSQALERQIGALLSPKMPWHELLSRYLRKAVGRQDYCWLPPNKKYLHHRVWLPSLREGRQLEAALAIDTSGSISQEILTQFLSEIQGVLEVVFEYKLHLFICDCDVHRYQLVCTGEDLRSIALTGYGGTAFKPVFDAIAEGNITPSVLVYFTDGVGSYPKKPKFPVIWVMPEGVKRPPFGMCVTIS